MTSSSTLSPCPICGAPAYVLHVYDGYNRADYGYDSGCPKARLEDGVHGYNFGSDIHDGGFPRVSGRPSAEKAIADWNAWVEKWKVTHNEAERNEE